MGSHYSMNDMKIKTTVLLEKSLLEEIDRLNPFSTRKDFLNQACKAYLKQLRRRVIDEELAKACAESEAEDRFISEEWEPVVLEGWR
jgi:metal-responsive CopG/Arc/MetJ family transcriptional regulator